MPLIWTSAGSSTQEPSWARDTPPSATPKKAARPAVIPMSAQLRSICPRAPKTFRASQLVVEPHNARSAASGPRLPPVTVQQMYNDSECDSGTEIRMLHVGNDKADSCLKCG
jgi:hypothetical protein